MGSTHIHVPPFNYGIEQFAEDRRTLALFLLPGVAFAEPSGTPSAPLSQKQSAEEKNIKPFSLMDGVVIGPRPGKPT